jgi:hypothetical protein
LIEHEIDYRAIGSLPATDVAALKAESLIWADRTSETLEAIKEAAALAERFEIGWWLPKLHRLRR